MSYLDQINDAVDEGTPVFTGVFQATVLATSQWEKQNRAGAFIDYAISGDGATDTAGTQHPPGTVVSESFMLVRDGKVNKISADLLKRRICKILGLPQSSKGVIGRLYDLKGRAVQLVLDTRPDKNDPSIVYQTFKKVEPLP